MSASGLSINYNIDQISTNEKKNGLDKLLKSLQQRSEESGGWFFTLEEEDADDQSETIEVTYPDV